MMKKAELLEALEPLDDDAKIEVMAEDDLFSISYVGQDWTSSADDPPQKVPDPKRGLIVVRG